jgi:hypothetical protein
MKVFLVLAAATALIAPVQASPALTPRVASSIILVEGDCGRDFHRDEHGACRPNEGGACPRGTHLGPEGHRCLPN